MDFRRRRPLPMSCRLLLIVAFAAIGLRAQSMPIDVNESKTLQLQAEKKYRFRLINISTNNQGMQVSLRNPNGPVEWRVIAKDGVDLPPRIVQTTKAQQTITVGETYDAEFSSSTAQDLMLDLLLPSQEIHTSQTLSFAPQARAIRRVEKPGADDSNTSQMHRE